MKRAPSQQMHVHMKHGLSRAGADVEHSPITTLDRALPRNLCCRQMTVTDEIRVFGFRFFESSNMFLRNHQHMGGSLRVDVIEGQRVLIFVNFFGRYFPANNAAKETISHCDRIRLMEFRIETSNAVIGAGYRIRKNNIT